MTSKLHRLGVMIAFGAVCTAIVVFSIPVCPTATIFHFPCPGCGLSRATMALLRGDFVAAFRIHPAVFIVLPVLGLYMLGQVATYVNPEWKRLARLLHNKWLERAIIGMMLVVIVLWVARFFGAFGGPVPV